MAALIQLACKGIQDMYLISDKGETNFRAVYQRHTQFAIQTIKNTFTTQPNFGGKFSCTIARVGDLLCKMYLIIILPELYVLNSHSYEVSWVKKVAFKLVKSVELEIGSIQVEKHYGEWYNIWYELTVPLNARYNELIGLSSELNKLSKHIPSTELAIPLSFWFNRDFTLALPLLSLQEQEIKINIELCDASACIVTSPTNYIKIKESFTTFKKNDILIQKGGIGKFKYEDVEKNRIYYQKIQGSFHEGKIYKFDKCKCDYNSNNFVTAIQKECIYFINCFDSLKLVDVHLLCEYVLLNADEKKKMLVKNLNRDYLIEQVLYCDEKIFLGPEQVFNVKFSNLCKELIWFTQLDEAVIAKEYFNYTNSIIKCNNECDDTLIKKETVLVDSIERITYRNSGYFTQIQPYTYHSSSSPGINAYSFSLYPEELQPSGSINLENISSMGLKLKLNKKKKYGNYGNYNNVKLRTYARIYNIFRLENNLGALLFNNNNI